MRWRNPLDEILGSRAKVQTLRVLWKAEDSLSGREVARRTGLSHTGALRALEELLRQGVLRLTADGMGTRYRLNRGHELIRRGVVPLVQLESSLEEQLIDAILQAVPRALSLVLFGSTARGEDAPESDADVMIVVPDDVDVNEAFEAVAGMDTRRRYGKDLGPVVWDRSTLLARHRGDHRLLGAIRRDGRVLAGASLDELIREDVGSAAKHPTGSRSALPAQGRTVHPKRQGRARSR